MEIKIKYHDTELQKNEKIPQGDWVDLRCAGDVHLNAGDFKIISLGVSMKIPSGYEAHLAPRSSTFKKWGIMQTNSVGVIDESYCGNEDVWGMPVYATRDIDIKKNERICQFRIIEKMPELTFCEVDNMENENRGGFGSSGSM